MVVNAQDLSPHHYYTYRDGLCYEAYLTPLQYDALYKKYQCTEYTNKQKKKEFVII